MERTPRLKSTCDSVQSWVKVAGLSVVGSGKGTGRESKRAENAPSKKLLCLLGHTCFFDWLIWEPGLVLPIWILHVLFIHCIYTEGVPFPSGCYFV